MFITIYGVNNIGKSTQSKMLVDNLNAQGLKAIHIKFPVYDLEPSGPFINNILRNPDQTQSVSENELQMWFALNRYQFEPVLKQYLKDGFIVIAEDYIGTSIAWGTAKGASAEWLESLNENLIQEDLSILLVGDRTNEATEKDHIHENNTDLILKVSENLMNLKVGKKWELVNRQEKFEDTQNLILDIVKKHLNC
jgi:dTMP kinase